MVFALVGDAVRASKIAEKWEARATQRGYFDDIWIPELRAAIELRRGELDHECAGPLPSVHDQSRAATVRSASPVSLRFYYLDPA
jgi:hypothetical protein